MLVVALTGGIGCGKSTAARLFANCGAPVIDADQLARSLVEPGQPSLDAIREHFGDDILTHNGALNRALLRERVFANPTDKQWLEALLHPPIRESIQTLLATIDAAYAIVEIQLLIEGIRNGMSYPYIHRIAVVDCSVEQQHQRSLQRGRMDAASIDAIIAQQATREQRLDYADDVIDNGGNQQQLAEQIKILDHKYRNPEA